MLILSKTTLCHFEGIMDIIIKYYYIFIILKKKPVYIWIWV